MPTLSPSIAGNWTVQGDAAVFTPTVGYSENTRVTVKIPGGLAGVISVAGANAGDGGTLGSDLSQSFTTGSFSTMRLQQLLAQLGYLPLTWTPKSDATISPTNAQAELAAAYSAPAGTFTWQAGYPSSLTDQWKAGSDNILDNGAGSGVRVGHRPDHGRERLPHRLDRACSRPWPRARTTPTATPTRSPASTPRRT